MQFMTFTSSHISLLASRLSWRMLPLHDDHVDRGESVLGAVVRAKGEAGIDQVKVLEILEYHGGLP